MNITFKNLEFKVNGDNKTFMTRCGHYSCEDGSPIVEIQIAGENRPSNPGMKSIGTSESRALSYQSHEIEGDTLVITQKSEKLLVKTYYVTYSDTNAVRVYSEIENISGEKLTLDEASCLVVHGIGTTKEADSIYFTEFAQSHHNECQPIRRSLDERGLYEYCRCGRVSFTNVGSWSSKERLPQGILENEKTGEWSMFEIEANCSWYYEMSAVGDSRYYLYLSGANRSQGSWYKTLSAGEKYTTLTAAICFGSDLNSVVGEMTKYRRHICGLSKADQKLPAIYNEYMHLSWDNPTEETTALYAPVVAKTGVEYYVIDCGWHNEEPGYQVYPYVGQWKESNARFPHGVKATTDMIRSLGMKPGLWIEPEVVGVKCQEMVDYYDDDCFFMRDGKRVAINNRYLLDYRNPKVIEYMSETIRRMVEDYGADYIKFDYNRDSGVGTELNASSAGSGLEEAADAFAKWVKAMSERFPHVVFEGCASGGMRMDYKSMSVFSMVSTSDQTNYLKYPCIVGNVLSAIIPEQAAVWSYPVRKLIEPGVAEADFKDAVITDNDVVINMVNSFLGRIHLASDLRKLTEKQLSLVTEGVEVYNSLSEMKKTALPYFPMGLTRFGKEKIAAGLKDDKTIYLAVWTLGGDKSVDVEIKEGIEKAEMVYPYENNAEFKAEGNTLKINFNMAPSAALFKITTK
ncbi:MAG: alpha-galactosidase [Oscillospiraceae bacterium]|nr:alpha-galactosidase [Oscillospiraceae bacterium]